MIRLPLTLLAVVVAWANPAMSGEAEDRAALSAFSQSWRAAYEAGDFAMMAELYEPDAWLMTRDQPARRGRDAILDHFAASRQAGSPARIRFDTEQLVIDGDYAFKTSRWWLEKRSGSGEPVRDAGRSLVIFKRGADGRWRLWRDIDNHTPDATFPLPEGVDP